MGKLDGKVAVITGAARGQGRSHAVTLASEGADIILFDLCEQLSTVSYPMSTGADLDETVRLVESHGRRVIAVKGDVRSKADLDAAMKMTFDEFQRLDIVLANAGIMAHSLPPHKDSEQRFRDSIDVMCTGVWNTLQASYQVMINAGNGGSIVITSSTQGQRPFFTDFGGGCDGYTAAKFAVVGLMRAYAATLAEWNIRVNTVHPTGVRTPMVVNEFFGEYMKANPKTAARAVNTLDVDMVEPVDVSRAVLYLVSDDARYVTGSTFNVDAGLVYAG